MIEKRLMSRKSLKTIVLLCVGSLYLNRCAKYGSLVLDFQGTERGLRNVTIFSVNHLVFFIGRNPSIRWLRPMVDICLLNLYVISFCSSSF